MRIKFRIWDKQKKQFLPENLRTRGMVLNGDGEIVFLTNQGPYPHPINGGMDRFEIQQFVNLKDKNGREVYEGDFIKYDYPKFKRNVCLVRWTNETEDNHPGFRIKDIYGQYGEYIVIGNICENPELKL